MGLTPARVSLLLAVPAILLLRGRWRVLRRNLTMVTAYGLIAIAGWRICCRTSHSLRRIPLGSAAHVVAAGLEVSL